MAAFLGVSVWALGDSGRCLAQAYHLGLPYQEITDLTEEQDPLCVIEQILARRAC
ncbi:hypothetical protein X744_31760 [Mesorhizobium sp. LNJC372A00]|nr:hypothetical protein X745_28250 [Mesorhizobium sp. LNJC374B00]ESY50939.1 hypothetical protein X744_31760 [Mesorhizobium sp. LNJC372A00]